MLAFRVPLTKSAKRALWGCIFSRVRAHEYGRTTREHARTHTTREHGRTTREHGRAHERERAHTSARASERASMDARAILRSRTRCAFFLMGGDPAARIGAAIPPPDRSEEMSQVRVMISDTQHLLSLQTIAVRNTAPNEKDAETIAARILALIEQEFGLAEMSDYDK